MRNKNLEAAINKLKKYSGVTDNEAFVGQLSSLVEPFAGATGGVDFTNADAYTVGGNAALGGLSASQPEKELGKILLNVLQHL